MARLVQLNSYYILTHLAPSPASIAAGTRHESRSQACGSREMNARTQQSTNACKVSGRAVTSFKSACRCLDVPVSYRYHQIWYTLLNADCKSHLGYAAQSNEDASGMITSKVQTRHQTHTTIPSDRICILTGSSAILVAESRLKSTLTKMCIIDL